MKKYTVTAWITLLLCLLSTGVILYAHGQLTAQGEDVSVTETVLFGDKKEAEGVAVTTYGYFSAGMNKVLHWKSVSSQRTDGLQTESEYCLNDTDAWNVPSNIPSATFDLRAGLPEDCSYDEVAPELDNSLKKVIEDASEGTQPGKTSTKIVDLSDYISSLPLYFRVFGRHGDDFVTDSGYFQFPLAENGFWKITTTKDAQGKLTEASIASAAKLDLWSLTAFDSESHLLYLAIDEFYQGSAAWSIPADQCGIHKIPLKKIADKENPDQAIYPDMSRAELLYPLDPDTKIRSMEVDSYRNNLLLFTEENGQLLMSVISLDDGTLKQKLVVFAGADDPSEISPMPQVRKDYILIWDQAQSPGFLYLCPDKDGSGYHIEGQSAFDGIMPEGYVISERADAFDGDRLVIACQPYDDNGRPINSSYLMVFRKSDLVYAGKYQNSLDTVYKAYRYYSQVWPWSYLAVSINGK